MYIIAKCMSINLFVSNGITQEKIAHTDKVLGETMPRKCEI
jgi:hypothetical protein